MDECGELLVEETKRTSRCHFGMSEEVSKNVDPRTHGEGAVAEIPILFI